MPTTSDVKRKALRRGLETLLPTRKSPAPNDIHVTEASGLHSGAIELDVSLIDPNPYQTRSGYDESALAELAASIQASGVIQPVIVRPHGDGRYHLIAGERRWRATRRLDRKTIPAVVRHVSSEKAMEMTIVENLQREDLNALEEASGIADLIETHSFTQEQVAQRLGKSRPSVTNSLRILSLSEPIKALIADGSVSAGHAKALLGAPEDARLPLARRVASHGLSVRALEKIVARLQEPAARGRSSAARSISPDDRDFEDRLRRKLGTRVALRRARRGGTIEVRYADETDLMRIADLLLGSD